MKVLIVEDDPTTAHLMKYVVGKHAEYEHAENGQEAYDEFCNAFERGEPFDLIFLDIMMPIADGQEVLQAIREFEEEQEIVQSQGVKVVMTTCVSDNKEVYQALAAGALDYLTKPVKKQKLEQILESVGKELETGGHQTEPSNLN
ncbi:MAG: response regulator [Bdellovibrionales bacterium]|nr:response regulator [Bdellovibrionales bacterium]